MAWLSSGRGEVVALPKAAAGPPGYGHPDPRLASRTHATAVMGEEVWHSARKPHHALRAGLEAPIPHFDGQDAASPMG
jgi:hypothetical protein